MKAPTHDPRFHRGLAVAAVERSVPQEYRDNVWDAAYHLLAMCFKDGRCPTEIQPTADGGVVFYWFPVPSSQLVYTCLEVFEDGEVIAAWTDGHHNAAWDLGERPGAEVVAGALRKLDAAFPLRG